MKTPSRKGSHKSQSHVSGHLENPPAYSTAPAPETSILQAQYQPHYINSPGPGTTLIRYSNINPGLLQPVVVQISPSPLDLLGEALMHDRFTLFPTGGNIGCCTAEGTIFVQLRDETDHPLLSFVASPHRVPNTDIHHDGDNHYRIQYVITLTDPAGQNLLTSTNDESSMTITSGGQVLGIVSNFDCCNPTFTANSTMGDILFKSVGSGGGCCRSPTEYSFMTPSGVSVGRLGPSIEHPGQMEVTFASDIAHDTRTKALVLYTAYYLYWSFFSETCCGNIGTHGCGRRMLIGMFLPFGIFFIAFLIFVPIIFATQVK